MSTLELKREGCVHVLTLIYNENENTLTQDVVEEHIAALDEVEAYQGNTSLLVTCDDPKTWCNGINLPWMMAQSGEDVSTFVKTFEELLYRMAMLNAPTIACINGNAYAGGAIIASAMDFRIMRSDRGRFCYPEINIKIPFTKMMIDIIDLIPAKQAVKNLALTGNAMTGAECFEAGVVDQIFPLEELQSEAMKFADFMGAKDRGTYTAIKRLMRSTVESSRS